MAIEKDAASDGKKSLLLLLSGGIGLLALLFVGWGYLNQPTPTPSQYAINNLANSAPVTSQETAQYQQLIKTGNRIGSEAAAASDGSFIASLRMSDVQIETPNEPPPPVALKTTAETDTTSVPQSGGAIQEDQKAALKSYLKLLNDRWRPSNMQLAGTFGQTPAAGEHEAGAGNNAFSQWSQSLPGREATVASEVPPSARTSGDAVIVPPNTRRPAVVDNAIDSDNLNSLVLAHIPAGQLAGAEFTAKGIQLAGDGVVIHFTRMTLNGVDYQVDAYALQDDTLQSTVSSDVNNRYVSRILLPALAMGIGKAGQLYEQQNTQILATNAGTISGGTGQVKGSALAGTVAGGIGTQAGQVMAADAARLPVKQVKVFKNQTIAIHFMKGVYASDRINRDAITTSLAGER
ncbi:conjugal transfer protein TraO [Serratia ureilytica]|uniref:conjugal transfer protein TraO n=1 Tax=Serratia ureilytica TaxID=300181 RepID=UPI00254A0FDA|nr:conjugal transfer protein TraO [Serratia ureilytica]